MEERSVTHTTFVVERIYPATPERVFAALSDPTKKRRWFAEGENLQTEAFEMDFRVGGVERSRFRVIKENTPVTGLSITNETTYQDIVPNCRIVLAYTMAVSDRRMSASLATFEVLPVEKGTHLKFTEQAAFFEGADGPLMREAGWRQILEALAKELAR
jgi:uncharacterized protein YndB with AHSA1/START domain